MRSLFSLVFFLIATMSYAQHKALTIDAGFKKDELNSYAFLINASTIEEALLKFNKNEGRFSEHPDLFYFNFNNPYRYLFFQIRNKDQSDRSLYLRFSNPLIREIKLYNKNGETCSESLTTGVDYPFRTRPEYHRNFVLPVTIEGSSSATYLIQLKKETGRPLVTSITAMSPSVFKKESSREYWLMGIYFGLCFIAILFSCFVFVYLKDLLYLYYGLYVLSLALYISSYLGLFNQFVISESGLFNTYFNYVFFGELSLLLFILFSQRALNTKHHTPRLKKLIEILVVVLLSLRLLLHFVFNSAESHVKVFMFLWYGFMILATIIIIIQTLLYFQKDRSKGSLFAFGLLFLEIGALGTVLYHSIGLFNTYWAGFPLIFYCSSLEVIFLTFFVVYMVKDIYDERNEMSKFIADQQKRILTSFIKGENKERRRIGKELHDNIGSQLTRLKLAIGGLHGQEGLEKSIDAICEDIRDLSHAIAPKELKFVSFVKAIEELSADIERQLNITISVSDFGFPEELNSPYREELYRVIQEALNNIIKHANATELEIQLFGHGQEISVSIEDNGTGFNYHQKQEGFGLSTMKTRINNLSGIFSIDTRENQGTHILLNIPYP